ncbi:MAG TPA: M48 family metalloprotease, partial [Candidatus Polarisedimenticolia bacterium]|nr:M48 family metalloprotease [Candidatus Polarisedimenticolia bacterium]
AALSKYSREHESQADELGAAYSTKAGYQPEAGITVMKILKWLEGKEPGALEKWFLSHPPADERIADIREQVAGLERADTGVKDRPIARNAYLRQIDGLIVGLHNGAETVLKDRYYNKELAVSMQVPPSFEVNLDPNGALVSMNREEKEYLILESAPMHTSVEAADVEKEFDGTLRRRGWTRTGGRQARTGQEVVVHLGTYTGKTSKNEPIGIVKGFLVRGKRTWTVTGLSELAEFDKRKEAYEGVALDLTFLSEEEAGSLRPPRLVIGEAPAGATWDALAAEHLADPNGGERLAFYNGLDPEVPPAEGTLLKLPPSLAPRP